MTGIKTNLHIALIMDCSNNSFTLNCESNPALYKECAVQWMESWSRDSMVKVSAYSQKYFWVELSVHTEVIFVIY